MINKGIIQNNDKFAKSGYCKNLDSPKMGELTDNIP